MARTSSPDRARLTQEELARRRLRRFVYFVLGAACLGVLASWIARHDFSDPRHGSAAVEATHPFRIKEVPSSYYVTYLVETHAGEKKVTNTDRVWMRRPFESRIETWKGAPPGKERLGVRQSSFASLASFSPRSAPLNIVIPPSLASGDLRIDSALNDALRRHVIVRRERRRVFGRDCQVYRAGGPVSAGNLDRYRGGSRNYADFCVDEHGILLEEWWISDGRLLSRRAATRLEIDPKIPDAKFRIAAGSQKGAAKGAIERLTRPDPTRKLWTLPRAPRGFEARGRYVVVRPSGTQPSFGGGEAAPLISTTDVFVRGPDLVIVDQDPSLAGPAASEDRATFPVHIKGFKEAVLVIDARSSEIRITTPDGSFVRLFGTLPPPRLVALAGQLKLVEG